MIGEVITALVRSVRFTFNAACAWATDAFALASSALYSARFAFAASRSVCEGIFPPLSSFTRLSRASCACASSTLACA